MQRCGAHLQGCLKFAAVQVAEKDYQAITAASTTFAAVQAADNLP